MRPEGNTERNLMKIGSLKVAPALRARGAVVSGGFSRRRRWLLSSSAYRPRHDRGRGTVLSALRTPDGRAARTTSRAAETTRDPLAGVRLDPVGHLRGAA